MEYTANCPGFTWREAPECALLNEVEDEICWEEEAEEGRFKLTTLRTLRERILKRFKDFKNNSEGHLPAGYKNERYNREHYKQVQIRWRDYFRIFYINGDIRCPNTVIQEGRLCCRAGKAPFLGAHPPCPLGVTPTTEIISRDWTYIKHAKNWVRKKT